MKKPLIRRLHVCGVYVWTKANILTSLNLSFYLNVIVMIHRKEMKRAINLGNFQLQLNSYALKRCVHSSFGSQMIFSQY